MLLILTEPFDPHADYVQEELQRRGLSWFRLHLSDFPASSSMTLSISSGELQGVLRTQYSNVLLSDISVVWNRRRESAAMLRSIPIEYREAMQRECNAFLDGLWLALEDKLWISTPLSVRGASSKCEQLLRAAKHGLKTPVTCMSNNASDIRGFVLERSTFGLVYKPYTSLMFRKTDGSIDVSYTRRVVEEDLNGLQQDSEIPGIFQEWIDKKHDIRATVVGNRLFAARIESQSRKSTEVDFRAAPWKDSPLKHEIVNLGSEIEQQCIALVQSYGLQFGAIDLVQSVTGDIVFLELNPNGQWAWIETLTDLPIRDALVDLIETVEQ